MYPDEVFLGLTLYDLCLCIGIIACFVVFGFLADKRKIKRQIQNYAMMCGIPAIVLGYGAAVLFQALYNIKSHGSFEINESTGATFYGGLIGGAAVFLALFFGVGYFKYDDKRHIREFFNIADCAAPSIVIAHALGRVGCLTAGCCHGAVTDAWYGIMMHGTEGYAKYVPVQLFEAIFLLFLFGFLFIRNLEKKGYCLTTYLCVYAVWRFVAEFTRADYRGDIFTDALTPSQFVACVLFAVGKGVFFLEKRFRGKFESIGADSNQTSAENELVTEAEKDDEKAE